jgi:putative spermidine/putrescine transport system ATP-binding protein
MTPHSAPVGFVEVSKRFGAATALDGFTLDVAAGEFVTLLGPSGSGKTTALNILAGFADATAGRVEIGGRPVGHLPPERRNVGMVFQSFALFPHMTVAENVAFPLRMRGVRGAAAARRVAAVLETVQMEALAARKPAALSGGQRQRVALARAIVAEPPVLLMDECLSALDRKLREELRAEIARLHRVTGTTVLFVTHDQSEALALSDRVAVMRAGRIEQVDPPRVLYDRPATRFVADFVGRANVVPVTPAEGGRALVAGLGMSLPWPGGDWLCLRPEKLSRAPPPGHPAFAAVVEAIEFQGAAVEFHARAEAGALLRVAEPRGPMPPPAPGDRITLGFDPGDAVPLLT